MLFCPNVPQNPVVRDGRTLRVVMSHFTEGPFVVFCGDK